MKKITKLFVASSFALAIGLTNISATNVIEETLKNPIKKIEEPKEKLKLEVDSDKKVEKKVYDDFLTYSPGVGPNAATRKAISNIPITSEFYVELTDKYGDYTASYYRKDITTNKWFNYKQVMTSTTLQSTYVYAFSFNATNNCFTTPTLYGCTNKIGNNIDIRTEYTYRYTNAQKQVLDSLSYTTYSTNPNDQYTRTEVDYYYYPTSIPANKITDTMSTKIYNSSNTLTYSEYNKYYSNGVLQYKTINTPTYSKYNEYYSSKINKSYMYETSSTYDSVNYYTNGKMKSRYQKNKKNKITTSSVYNTNGSMTYKDIYNSTTYKTISAEAISYYSNKRVNEKAKTNYSSGKAKSGTYYKYRSNGKIQYKKNMSFNNYYPTKITTYAYNSKGELKSNKNGKAYRYVTSMKKNSYTITSVVKAQYNSKGKLGRGSKVKPNTLTRKYYKVY